MKDETRLDSVVFAFLIYRVVSRFTFYVPIFVVALVVAGFSFLQIGENLFVYGLSTLLAGNLGRRLLETQGPVALIVIGESFKALSNVIIGGALAGLFGIPKAPVALVAMLVAQFVGGVGYAMAAIGDGSYLSLAAPSMHAQATFQEQAQARSSSAMFISFMAAGIVGALSFRIVPWLPFAMTAGANLLAGLIAGKWLKLARIDPLGDAAETKQDVACSSKTASVKDREKVGVRQRSASYSVRAWLAILGYALLRANVIVMQLLILPVLFYLILNIEVVYFGWLFALYTLSGFLGGRLYPILSA